MDVAIYIALVLSFATVTTAHIALVFGLTLRPPHWKGPVGLLVPPLAPYWGFREGFRVRTIVWLVGLAAYAVALGAGYFLAR